MSNMKMKNWSKYRPEEFKYIGGWIRNWFSNFQLSPIEIDGVRWPSVENYYQAMKTTDSFIQFQISQMTPAQAKKVGRSLVIRPNWDEMKFDVMKKALKHKFLQDEWMDKLLNTGDDMIIEWNNWNDKIWGVSVKDNMGMNMLGIALMEIREEIKDVFLLKGTKLERFTKL